jgi:catechol-2,3-dioxygenase
MRLFRVLLEVSDLEMAAFFYDRLFAVKGKQVAPNRSYYDCGGVILGLVDISSEERDPTAIPEFLYFAVGNLEEIYDRARVLDCLSKEDIHERPAGDIVVRPRGERSFYAMDPFGNGLCFVDENTLFTGA